MQVTSPTESRAVVEHAVYICSAGHEQPHSGGCLVCGRVTDLERWDAVPPTREQLAAREELRQARAELEAAKDRVRLAVRRVFESNDAPAVWS